MTIKTVIRSDPNSIPNQRGVASSNIEANRVLSKEVLDAKFVLPKISETFSGIASGGSWSLINDTNSLYCSGTAFAGTLAKELPNAFPEAWGHLLDSTGAQAGYHAFGIANSMGAVTSAASLLQNTKQIKNSQEIGDREGVLLGRVSVVKDAASIVAGAYYGVSRPISVYNAAKSAAGTSTPTLLGRVTVILGMVGAVLFGIAALLISVTTGICLYKAVNMHRELSSRDNLDDKITFIDEKFTAHGNLILEELIEKHGLKEANRILIHEAYDAGEKQIEKLIAELGIEGIEKEQFRNILTMLITQQCEEDVEVARNVTGDVGNLMKNIDIEGINKEELSSIRRAIQPMLLTQSHPFLSESGTVNLMSHYHLLLMGLGIKVQKKQMVKDAQMKRIFTASGCKAIKELRSIKSLEKRVSVGSVDEDQDAKIQTLVAQVEKSSRGKIPQNVAIIAVCLLGIAAIVTGILFTSGIPLIIASAVSLVSALTTIVLDGYFLHKSYMHGTSQTHDKKLIVGSMVLGIASTVTVLLLAVTGVVTMSPFAIVSLIVLASLWLGQNGVALGVTIANEEKKKKKHPTLESFLEFVRSCDDPDKKAKLFENLPEPIKKMFKAQHQAHGEIQDVENATVAVIQAIENAKTQRLESLRASLSSYVLSLS